MIDGYQDHVDIIMEVASLKQVATFYREAWVAACEKRDELQAENDALRNLLDKLSDDWNTKHE